ncbi:hypothetical protein OPIT5_05730 [Opitutaceae bacterium TAV5]|nr:hypothetical protein OPIT5_05730 [Opitutaceae bacterium TAV5]
MTRKTLTVLSALCLQASGFSAQAAEAPPPPSAIRNFSGVCQGFGKISALNEFVGWERDDVYWDKLEPKPGQWNQAELEKWGQKILQLRAQGVQFLPILDYSARWAVDSEPRTLHFADGRRVEIKPDPSAPFPGAMIETTFIRNAATGAWEQTGAGSKTVKNHALSQLGAAHVPAWEAYVRRVVTFLSAPPYNLRYFQVWNEAHAESGFWRQGDDLDVYMQRVHLPAAKIIRELGSKVVYGGWPCCGSVQEYVALLDRNNAWESIDVHDLHYFPVSSFEYIHRAAEKRDHGSPSIWQTEIGFTTDPTVLANEYPRYLDWALRKGWDPAAEPDKYKLFWFAAQSPDDPKAYGYKHSLMLGDKLHAHGLSLKTLVALLSPGQFGRYTDPVETSPVLHAEIDERKSSLEAFTADDGRKIVLALHLAQNNTAKIFTDWNGDLGTIHLDHGNPTITVTLPVLSPGRILSVRRVDAAGTATPLVAEDAANSTTLVVPIRDSKDSPSAKWMNDGPVRTFYVEITLKP